MPANAHMFFARLTNIAAFDFSEVGKVISPDFPEFDELVNMALELPFADPLNERFEASGLESIYFINNLGSFYFILMFYFTLYAVYICFKCCQKLKWVKRLDRKLQRKLYCDGIYVVVRESFQIMVLCGYLSFFYKFSLESKGLIVQKFTAIVSFVFYIFVPFLVFTIVICRYSMVGSE